MMPHFIRGLLALAFVMPIVIPNASTAQSPINKELAPMGKLRVAMNAGTAVLLTRTSDGLITGIGAGLNSSSDQFLRRNLKSAQVVHGLVAADALRSRQVDVWAASASNIAELAKKVPEAKLVPGSFTSERTMVILPKGRSAAARAKVVEVIDQAKKLGVVQKSLEQTGVKGVLAAP
jgi:ABC-type amino acid transport substrate-binding protein